MSAPWACVLLMTVLGPARESPRPEAALVVRPASEREHREALDFVQLALGEWVAARHELRRELEALRRRDGGTPAAMERLERWRAADVEAEVRRIQDGLNAARRRAHRGVQGGVGAP